ncbi:MAG TPA: hypothetical protein VFU29_04510 [Chitinophagaceae bacterium]|jgi:hypothetical protein|nr:hypothetical protein [Chitinophagaceae bacterium]
MVYGLAILCLFAISSHAPQPRITYMMSDDHDAQAISAFEKWQV